MNRHVYGDMLPLKADVPDCVKVVPGDLMILCKNVHTCLNADLRTKSGVTGYAYPLAAGVTGSTNAPELRKMLLGVALDDSPNGSTDTISIATAGVFQFPLTATGGVTLGNLAKYQTPTGFSASAQTTGSYQIQDADHLGGGESSGNSLGYVVKTETSAKNAFIQLRSAYGPGGCITDG